jgi:CO/xanthine dehydrogenase Mo-binding subunit
MMGSEQFIDDMLAEINADPVECRKKWAEKPGDPCTLRYAWSEFCGGNYVALIEKAAAEFGWNEKWKGWGVPISVNGDKKRGIGVALSMHITGTSGMRGLVKVNNDGSGNVLGAVMDVGQGIKTATAQCVAEVLGVPYDKVTCNLSNTEGQVPGGVCASLGTPCVIGAAINAAWNAKEQLFDLAAAALGVSVKDLDIGDEKIFVKADPSKFRTIAALAASRSMIIGHGWEVWPWKNADGFPLAEKSLAAMFAEVEVDTGTGKIEIIEMVSAADCGQVIHRDSVFGQMYQGVVFGYGYGMYGNLIYDKAYQGIALNVDALNYRIPTAIEYGDIHCIIHTDPADAPTCNMGVKGCGEGTNVPVAPAIGNAFFNATGARLRHHPWTPDKVLEALGKI